MSKISLIKLVTLSFLFIYSNNYGQNKSDLDFNFELDLFQPLLGGYGVTIGVESNHWGAGVMGFNTPLSSFSKDYILKGAEDFNIQNWGLELYTNYFVKEKQKGLHFGALISLDGYRLSNVSFPEKTILGIYIVPKIGYRWIMFQKLDWLYLQPSLATPILVWNDASKIKTENIIPNKILFLPMLTLGVKFPIRKQ